MDYLKKDNIGTTIRQPAVANLMIDSVDRDVAVYPSPFQFQITKSSNLQNGFFTRIAATEVVLEWCEPNINDIATRTFSVDISGVGGNTYAQPYSIALQFGFYTVQKALDAIVDELNDATATTGATFSINQTNQGVFLDCSGAVFWIYETQLAENLGFQTFTQNGIYDSYYTVGDCPDLRYIRYIDFVSEQLTYAQAVKDSATNPFERNVLLRWYMSYDQPPLLDGYDYPILMGYTPFVVRRLFNPPKQIRWDSNLPVGNLAFTLYSDQGTPLEVVYPAIQDTEWLMTLQLSEN